MEILEQKEIASFFSFTAQIERKACQPMGDICFDPQVGLYEPSESQKKMLKKVKRDDEKQQEVKYLSNIDTDLIDCDKDY